MKQTNLQMYVQLSNGKIQLIKPNMTFFDGNWVKLAKHIYGYHSDSNFTPIFKLS